MIFCLRKFFKSKCKESILECFFKQIIYSVSCCVQKQTMTLLYNERDWRESGHDIITLYYMSLRGKWDLSDLCLLIQNSFKQLLNEVWGLYIKQIFDPTLNESPGLVESLKKKRQAEKKERKIDSSHQMLISFHPTHWQSKDWQKAKTRAVPIKKQKERWNQKIQK